MRFFVIIRTAIMDNKNFTKLVELLEHESAARIASETSRLAENAVSQQIISDLNATIKQLNETIGGLLEEIRLLKGPKKIVETALFLLQKMKTALLEPLVYEYPAGSLPEVKRGMKAVL